MALCFDLRDVRQNCRICLGKNINLVSVSSSVFVINDTTGLKASMKILDIMNLLMTTKVEAKQGYPTGVCCECLILVNETLKFKSKLETSTTILDNMQAIQHTKVIEAKNEETECNDSQTESENEGQSFPSKPHHCPICMVQLTALELKNHIQTHDTFRKYLNAPSRDKLKKKMVFYAVRKEVKPKTKTYMCPFCYKHLPLEQFRPHIDEHDTKGEFQCEVCNRTFRQIGHLTNHRLQHVKELPYKCEVCSKGFVIKRNYEYHILTHKGDVLPHECHDCGKRFANPLHLRRHSLLHTDDGSYTAKYRVIRCKECKITFKSNIELVSHECIEIKQPPKKKPKEKRLQCPICPKTFSQKNSLYQHKMKIHLGKQKKWLCQVCGISTRNLKNHMMKHNDDKPHKCEKCMKRFSTKLILDRHLLIHTGEKPFMCSMCAKTFNNLHNLKMHERIHIGNKCHICLVCGKGFLEASYLRKHLLVHNDSAKKTKRIEKSKLLE